MSQNKQIKAYLDAGNSLTPIEALMKFGCFRLAARIKELRESGMNIETLYEELDGKRFARYVKVLKDD